MMYSISRDNVPTYRDGTNGLVYLMTTVERLQDLGAVPVFTDRNAVLELADFWSVDDGELSESFIDWDVMRARYWASTPDFPDRRERRMAECLVKGRVPFEAFQLVAARSEEVRKVAMSALRDAGLVIDVVVRPDWYF